MGFLRTLAHAAYRLAFVGFRRTHRRACRVRWPSLWFENKDGVRWVPDLRDSLSALEDRPEGFDYQCSSFACYLEESVLRIKPEGGSESVMTGHAGYWRQVVEEMVRAGFPLNTSIQIAAHACERCMNALAHEFGVGGYSRRSEAYKKAGTSCEICYPVHVYQTSPAK